MRKTGIFLTLISFLPYHINSIGTCVPNTHFVINNRLCVCNIYGLWNEAGCTLIERRHFCRIGQIVREGCNQCVCQKNGQFACANVCTADSLSAYIPNCIPFKSYYINCNLCTCPASGHSAEAHCSKDSSCSTDNSIDFQIAKKNYCIPSVMYIFPCIECLCSENGFFVLDKCVEKCQTPAIEIMRRCIPGTYYRNDCDVCLCPENSNLDESLCSKSICRNDTKQPVFLQLSNSSLICTPNTFLKPRCLYCDCNLDGTVNENRCVEIDCLKASNFQLYPHRSSCSPGEVVPNCIECFCPKNGVTHRNYCTNVCNYQNKLRLLEKISNESYTDIIDLNSLKKKNDDEFCGPNSVYTEDGKLCLCPESGYKSFKFCTTSKILFDSLSRDGENVSSITICEPGTFVEVDCNSCYCSVSGKIDSKWCTYDDCVSKKIIEAAHKSNILPITTVNVDGTCTPGSISKVQCNFCICPDSGILKDRACTKNSCYDDDVDKSVGMDRFSCEPLAYYEVDCNICFCPKDGIKNVAKCTKNHCQKSFLRSDVCTPGHLFTVGCNVCVCPTNGDKTDRVCTEHRCGIEPLNLQKISQNLLQNVDKSEKTRSLDHCFPGEEFTNGCRICMCPEMGLKMYASCETMACDNTIVNHTTPDNVLSTRIMDEDNTDTNVIGYKRVKRFELDLCMEYTVQVKSERQSCTPGSMYIVRCKQCICPYMGNINLFCRPLPQTTYCEQAYPGFNYLPMGRKYDNTNTTENKDTNSNGIVNNVTDSNKTIVLKVEHKHTKYKCDKPGKILDECFICNCEDGNVIEEHCFKNDAENCTNEKPSFLIENKVVLGYFFF